MDDFPFEVTYNGEPIKMATDFKVKLTKEQKKEYKKYKSNRKKNKGSIKLEWVIEDPYKEFKEKLKAQIR
jgi:hypothetical protein